MKNIFEESYEKEQELREHYERNEELGNETGMDECRQAARILWDSIEDKGTAYPAIFRAYKEARQKGNRYIDFHDVIWEKDAPELIASLRESGIEYFTFSSGWSGAVEVAWIFKENGCQLRDLILINGDEKSYGQGDYEKAPAYLFRIG